MKKLSLLFTLTMLFTSNVFAKTCEIEISSNDRMQFDKKELTVSSECKEVQLTLKHSGKLAANVMGHNWVLTETSNYQKVGQEGMRAGLENQYVPPNDSRVLAFTKIIGGGESTQITFNLDQLSKEKSYTFFCSFPGHWAIMNGTFKIE